jgi:hypothetical protein
MGGLSEIACRPTIMAISPLLGQLVNAFEGVVLISIGVAWGVLWVSVFASITDDAFVSDTRVLQITIFFVMLLGILPFGFGIDRLVK